MNEDKIDFVIIWVDGSDPEWLKEKEKYDTNKNCDSRNIRYRDWDNLQYWFRGIEKFAPWVNKVHFVTCGHLPKWLNTNHPKLNIVKHSDYIPEEYLPTFSSHVIELNLHRIKGLAEKFVYFNDDTFIIDNVNKEDFFKNGLPTDVGILSEVSTKDLKMFSIYYNNLAIINSNFKKSEVLQNRKNWFNLKYGKHLIRTILAYPWRNFIGFYNCHCPQPYLKETFYSVWNTASDNLIKTCKNKFRDSCDVNQYLFRYWQLCSNKFSPRKISFSKSFTLTDDDTKILTTIKNKKFKTICINDSSEISNENFNKFKSEIKYEFEQILPEKSSFEK